MSRTRVIETDARDEAREHEEMEERRHDDVDERWIDDESEADLGGGGGGWGGDDEEPIAPRPRGRWLRPLPLALLAVSIAAAGFLGGVLAQKGSEGGGSASLPGGAGLPSFAAAAGKEGAPTAGGSEGAAAAGAGAGAVTGTVTAVEGRTIYVKESDGTIVAVKAGDGATVTRDSDVAARKVHPGDSVVVQGSEHGSTVKASSVAATESGVESTAALGAPTAAATGAEAGTSVESLFEE